jgi:hypothetical protein
VLGPLSALVADHPLVEPLTAAFMRAPAAVGRSAEAPAAFAAIRPARRRARPR